MKLKKVGRMKSPKSMDRLSPSICSLLAIVGSLLFFMPTCPAWAGSTASEWVIAVNGSSERSRTLANHYAAWRGIPSINIIVLNQVPGLDRTSAAEFQDRILNPLLAEIDRRNLSRHIQGIAYSCDFPTSVDMSPDYHSSSEKFPNAKFHTPIASLTGLTYLYRSARSSTKSSPKVQGLSLNYYAGQEGEQLLLRAIDSHIEKDWAVAIDRLKSKDPQDEEKARAKVEKWIEDEPENYGIPYLAARAWSEAGKHEQALEFLEVAVAEGWAFRKQLAEDPKFESLREEARFQFLRDSCPDYDFDYQPTRGFDARLAYTPAGYGVKRLDRGVTYLMSVALAVTHGAGCTLEESLQQLHTATHADWTMPKGKYFIAESMSETDVARRNRSLAIKRLSELGYAAQSGFVLPTEETNFLGASLFSSVSDLNFGKDFFHAGAIADNTVENGGAVITGTQRSNLRTCLMSGAAGTSGTVTDAFAVDSKHPHPMLHAHYVTGATLAESYYLAVRSPYQLLIVGDPLCQPFATPPRIEIEGLEHLQRVEHQIRLQLKDPQKSLERQPMQLRLLVDGRMVHQAPFAEEINLNLDDGISLGSHALTLIVSDDSMVQNKWEWSQVFVRTNSEAEPKVGDSAGLDDEAIVCKEVVSDTKDAIKIHCHAPEGFQLQLMHDFESIATIDSNDGDFEISVKRVGRGPVRFQALAIRADQAIASVPITVNIPLNAPTNN